MIGNVEMCHKWIVLHISTHQIYKATKKLPKDCPVYSLDTLLNVSFLADYRPLLITL